MFAESSKTFNNSWMQLHTILKFGSFVVLLDPLKIFQNLVVQMFDIIFMANQIFHNTFPMEKPYKYSVHYSPFPNLCNGAKPHVSVVDTFAVTNNHLVGRNVNSVEKKSTFNFKLFFRVQLNVNIL